MLSRKRETQEGQGRTYRSDHHVVPEMLTPFERFSPEREPENQSYSSQEKPKISRENGSELGGNYPHE
jgi:hypothetical protein